MVKKIKKGIKVKKSKNKKTRERERERKKKVKKQKWIESHKILFISLILFISILLLISGTKSWLYLNLLLGNDIILKLDVDKRDINILHGQNDTVKFEAKVTTNPFCNSICTYSFIDISNNNILEEDQFKLRPGSPFEKIYFLKPNIKGEGLLLYRFDMECNGIKNFFCHTHEEPSTRSILITLYYDLNEEEEKIKQEFKEKTDNLLFRFNNLQNEQNTFENISSQLDILLFEDETINNQEKLDILTQEFKDLQKLWDSQEYYNLLEELKKTDEEITETENIFEEYDKTINNIVLKYNSLVDDFTNIRIKLDGMSSLFITDNKTFIQINEFVEDFNQATDEFKIKSNLNNKEVIVQDIDNSVNLLKSQLETTIRKEVLIKEMELDINYDSLCLIIGNCSNHPSISERANQSYFDMGKTCSKIQELNKTFSLLNESLYQDYLNENYSESHDFWNNISQKLKNIKNDIVIDYLEKNPENQINTEIIEEILTEEQEIITEDYNGLNITLALFMELISKKPGICNIVNETLLTLVEVDINQVVIDKPKETSLDIIFKEHVPECCFLKKCKDCCITEDCNNNNSYFPVVFLHGHSINEGTSAEYSLEGFNKIQKKIEQDGYLNAGTITLFSGTDSPQGIWGLPQIPLTIRASYYFDVFKQPENYIVVQTKSENIDTYAIRLKDLIDTIKYKTGKPQVNIVAFSMGGLVARRYIQIFGIESTNKLIMIGTPNKGIVGNILDYCPITGEKLECRDMNSESLFINKLNSGPLPNIPIYNIVGTGCKMGKNQGDGAVLEENAYLEGAENFIINGTCSTTKPLHLKLRDIDLYQKVYYIIIEALKEEI